MPDTPTTAGTPAEHPPTDVNALLAILQARLAPPAELLTRETFAALLDVGVSTFDRLKESGKIGPRPIRLAGLKWHRVEVVCWLANRDQAGELYDAETWPAVWASLQGRRK